MKKLLCTATVLLILLFCSVGLCAAGEQGPTIEGQMPDCYGVVGESDILLFSNVKAPEKGTLVYQWYSTTVENMETIKAIDGATGETYAPPPKRSE